MRKLILAGAMIAGALAALGGLTLGLLLALSALLRQGGMLTTPLQNTTVALSVVSMGLAFGLALLWTGWRGLSGKPDGDFALPRWGWWLLALVAVLGLGQLAISVSAMALLPFFHIAAGALPALLFLSLATGAARKHGRAEPARPMTGSLSWGGTGAAGLAMSIEFIILLFVAILATFWLTSTNPDLVARLQDWALEMQRRGRFEDLGPLVPLITSPLVALAVLGGIGLVVPFIEEISKSLAVPLVALAGRKLTKTDGFLLGVASGAGFAILEGMLNGSLALGMTGAWGAVMLLRGGTAAIHCLASGLAGWGWQAVLTERKWGRGLALGVLAIALHGTWNFLAGAQTLLSLRVSAGGGSSSLPGAWFTILIILAMGALWLASVIALYLIPAHSPLPRLPMPALPVTGEE